MQRRPGPQLIFGSAILLLIVCASASGWALYRMYSAENWVRHTYTVRLTVADIISDLGKSGRARQDYLRAEDEQYLQDIESSRKEINDEFDQLKSLVHDNSDEEKTAERLQETVNGRFRVIDKSLELIKSGKSTHEAQDALTLELVNWSRQATAISDEMQNTESRLLDRRVGVTDSFFLWIIAIFGLTFLLSLYMLWEHYRGLNRELSRRIAAERSAQNLSAQLLTAQDQERRKIARDLHDGLGQCLAAAKMIVDTLVNRPPEKQNLKDLSEILDDAISSTRTMSHLLHPPLVEEIGFASAARTYLEGFGKRSGVKISYDVPDEEERLPRDLELILFRVLQESLTNIQKHSKSSQAEVMFHANRKKVTLTVRDHGVGLPPEILKNFNENGANVGVGLAGMKERARERNGQFEIFSDAKGTFISATFPVASDSSASS